MKNRESDEKTTFLSNLLERYPILSSVQGELCKAHREIHKSLVAGGTLFLCGNGGSAADCEHIVGELMKGFLSVRPLSDARRKKLEEECSVQDAEFLSNNLQTGLRAISLVSHPSLATAMSNDVSAELIFAQQLNALGRSGDVLLAISTSGNARNVVLSAAVAWSLDMKVVALTGRVGGDLRRYADILIAVDETETFKVQELHLPVYHTLCAMLENSVLNNPVSSF
jgi:D-sedoheptulose 7-phosphate isomerase